MTENVSISSSAESPDGVGLILDATTLPAETYISAKVFGREQERIFSKFWLCLGRDGDVGEPGDFFTRDVGGESILVVRGADGEVRAFYNVCRHRGARLVDETEGANLKRLVCPYHAWSYGLDGALRSAPLTGDCFDKSAYPLITLRLERWMGFLFLNLDDEAQPLNGQLTGFPDVSRYRLGELRRGARITYDVDANWKLLGENYGECYHCAVAHPQLQRVSDFRSGGHSVSGPAFTGGPMELREGFETMSSSGLSNLPEIPGLGEEDHRLVHYYNLYPNFLLSLHPDYVMTHTLWPQSAERTHVVCEWLFTREALAREDFDPSDAVEFWDLTNRQDWELCQRVQLGARSRGYRPGPYQAIEVSAYNFDRWYRQVMDAG